MELWQALVLGVVEGLTEFVPVSSTGHLILVQHILGLRGPAVSAYAVVIQLGALLAAVYYYRRTLLATAQGLLQKEPAAQRLWWLPAAHTRGFACRGWAPAPHLHPAVPGRHAMPGCPA